MSVSSVQDRATLAETQAKARISAAERKVKDAEKQSQSELDSIQNQTSQRAVELSANEQAKLEDIRLKGYEDLRRMQRSQDKEERHIQTEGERASDQLRNHYQYQQNMIDTEGRDKVRQSQSRTTERINFEEKKNRDEITQLQSENRRNLEHERDAAEHRLSELIRTQDTDFERMKENSIRSRDASEKNFEERMQAIANQHDTSINRLYEQTTNLLETIRQDTADQLTTYERREDDPFYQLMTFDTNFSETQDEYVLTVTVPDYEKDHINVSVRGDSLVLSGYRSNQEKLNLEDGHTQNSAAYQSFNEIFPLTWPVDGKRLSRTYSDEQLTFRLPKKNQFGFSPPPVAPQPQRVRAEAPRFPENLKSSSSADKPRPKTSRNGPLG